MVWGRSFFTRREQPKSDVPELERITQAEDKEVIEKPAIPEDEAAVAEELGFGSVAEMKKANDLLAQIAKEKDQVKASKLKAELRAVMDDSDTDFIPEKKPSLDVIMQRVEDIQQTKADRIPKYVAGLVDSDLEQAIGNEEFKFGMAGVANRLALEVAKPAEVEDYKREIEILKNKLLVPKPGTDETPVEKRARSKFERDQKTYQEAETELYEQGLPATPEEYMTNYPRGEERVAAYEEARRVEEQDKASDPLLKAQMAEAKKAVRSSEIRDDRPLEPIVEVDRAKEREAYRKKLAEAIREGEKDKPYIAPDRKDEAA